MALGLYMDVHVPAAITASLRRRGIDVLTCQDDSMRQADDENLLRRATQLRRIMVSQDEDFLSIASVWQKAGWEFFGLVFAPQRGASIGRYIDDLDLIATCCTAEEIASSVFCLPLN